MLICAATAVRAVTNSTAPTRSPIRRARGSPPVARDASSVECMNEDSSAASERRTGAARAALTIAGSDPSGGAGIQADLKTFAAFGVYGVSAISAVTVQNTQGVDCVSPLEADLVEAQIEAVASDVTVHATKTGMLATAAIVEAVTAAIDELDL